MQHIFKLTLFTCILLGVFLVSSTAKVCKAIHIGTDTKSNTINDIIADGETSKLWREDSYSPVIVTHSKKMDYFYMVNLEVDIDSSNVHLTYDNPGYANSTVSVKEEAGKKHWYTLEVLYNCEAYGGALLTYKLEVEVPDCGSAEFVWKKVCGHPLTPRDGFTIDMTYSDTKINIVKNGVPVNEKFWDPEVKDWAINIPKDVDTAKFEIYMNPDDIKSKQDTLTNNTNLIDSLLASIPETTVSGPKIDSDDVVATVTIDGPLVGKGGVVKKDKSVLNMNFTCERVKDYSTVEFVIPMTNFRDINLYFYKECDNAGSVRTSWLFWILVIGLTYLAYKTFVNFSQGAKGVEAIPFISEIKAATGWLLEGATGAIQKLSNSSKSSNSMGNSKPSRTRDDEDPNEFNIKNISEVSKADTEFDENKYGTI